MHKFLTLLIFLLVAPGVSAFQGYDECGEFEAALIEAQFPRRPIQPYRQDDLKLADIALPAKLYPPL